MDNEMRTTTRPRERRRNGVWLIGLGCGLLVALLVVMLLVGGAFVAGQLTAEGGQVVMSFTDLFERPEELPGEPPGVEGGEGGQAEEGTMPTIAAFTATPAPTPSPRLHLGEGGMEGTAGPPEQPEEPPGEPPGGESQEGPVGPPEWPEELPDEPPDVSGVCLRRDGNSLFLGVGNYSITVGPGGVTEVDYDGPEVEVVVTPETEIYAERVEFPQGGATPPQHIVQPGSLDDVVQGTGVRVWGEREGDHIVARVLVYQAMAGRIERP